MSTGLACLSPRNSKTKGSSCIKIQNLLSCFLTFAPTLAFVVSFCRVCFRPGFPLLSNQKWHLCAAVFYHLPNQKEKAMPSYKGPITLVSSTFQQIFFTTNSNVTDPTDGSLPDIRFSEVPLRNGFNLICDVQVWARLFFFSYFLNSTLLISWFRCQTQKLPLIVFQCGQNIMGPKHHVKAQKHQPKTPPKNLQKHHFLGKKHHIFFKNLSKMTLP